MHVYRALPSYDPARDLRPWVFTIATNKVRDHWRSRRHADSQREGTIDGEESALQLPSEQDGPEEDCWHGELAERVGRP